MTSIVHACAKARTQWDGTYSFRCSRRGTIEEEGKWWCGQHPPSAVRNGQKERSKRWQESRDKDNAFALDRVRKLIAFDDLLAACEALVESFAPLELEGILVVRMDMLKTAIAKAKGESDA